MKVKDEVHGKTVPAGGIQYGEAFRDPSDLRLFHRINFASIEAKNFLNKSHSELRTVVIGASLTDGIVRIFANSDQVFREDIEVEVK